mgnify:CR=1 FL=1
MISGKKRFSDNPVVSLVIPTFNSEKTLAVCLESIERQTYSNVEVVVVDNYSRDNTVRIAKRFNARVLSLASERCSARNLGAKEAHGDFIFFMDSDMELTPTVIEECVATCINEHTDAVIIPEVSVGEGFLAECRKMEKETSVGDKFSEAPRFFKKEVFNSVGGYDENLISGEDFDFGTRTEKAGYKIWRVKAEIMHHEGELSMKKIALKTYYYGKTLPSFVKKNPSLAMKTSCPTRYLKNIKLLRKHRIRFFGFVLIKLIEYISYLIGVFTSLLRV